VSSQLTIPDSFEVHLRTGKVRDNCFREIRDVPIVLIAQFAHVHCQRGRLG